MSLSLREVLVGVGTGVVLVGAAILLVKGTEKIAKAIRGCRGVEDPVEGTVVEIVGAAPGVREAAAAQP